MSIYALRVNSDPKCAEAILNSLRKGEARFCWSAYEQEGEDKDLRRLQKLAEQGKLPEEEWEYYQPFLLNIKKDDYVVYINVPQYGQCTSARVTSEYYWKAHTDLKYNWGYDGNHCLSVDPESIRVFERNGVNVTPYLQARLKLQGRFWKINAEDDFFKLQHALTTGKQLTRNGSPAEFLSRSLQPVWEEIAVLIQQNYPGKKLEELVCKAFNRMPNVETATVNATGSHSDYGADVIVTYFDGFAAIPELCTPKKLVIQVKSYEGEHYSLQAVSDIEKAVLTYNADAGLIFSTGKSTEQLRRSTEKLVGNLKRPIGLCTYEQSARLLMRYLGDELIDGYRNGTDKSSK